MRPVVYSVAMSLDGFIAGPDGEYDWIPTDVGIDWGEFMARFDTVLLGRKSFELTLEQGGSAFPEGMRQIVFSRTLRPEDHPGVTVVSEDAGGTVDALRRDEGEEIWLFGGGELFSSLLAAGVVDRVEVAVVPVLLGAGRPLLPAAGSRTLLSLEEITRYGQGVVSLHYGVSEGVRGA